MTHEFEVVVVGAGGARLYTALEASGKAITAVLSKLLLDCSFLTASAALNREESRGGHSREDHPERDDAGWLKHSLAWLRKGGVRIDYKPVEITRWKPKPRTY